MKSRWIVNLLLLVAVAGLALVAWYEPGIEETPAPQALSALQPDEIERIRIQRGNRDDLILMRSEGAGWTLEAPAVFPADTGQVAALTRLAAQKPERSYPAAELDLARLGLDPPRSTVMLDAARFDFGDTEPLEELRYVRRGDQVHLVPDIYQYLIDADFTRFVRRRLLPDQAAVVALKLPGLSLEKSAAAWTIEPHREVAADRIQQLIDNWNQAAALSIGRTEVAAEGDSVTLTLDAPERELTFIIAAREPELVLVRPDLGLEYHLGNLGERLLALPPDATPAEK